MDQMLARLARVVKDDASRSPLPQRVERNMILGVIECVWLYWSKVQPESG